LCSLALERAGLDEVWAKTVKLLAQHAPQVSLQITL